MPFENGDRMSAERFMRRYERLPGLSHVQLVEGVVYMPSPVRYTQHAMPQHMMSMWLGTFALKTPGVESVPEATLRLDGSNVPQPDVVGRITEAAGGGSSVDDDGYLRGRPELLIEIAASSSSIDLHDKREAYRRNGVPEYLVWRPVDEVVDWFVLEEGRYVAMEAEQGLLKSRVLPGLWLDVAAAGRRDLAAVLQTLERGLDSDEHAAFAARVQAAAGATG